MKTESMRSAAQLQGATPLTKKSMAKVKGQGGCYVDYIDCGWGLITFVCCPHPNGCEMPC
jgi:hypothetical protein